MPTYDNNYPDTPRAAEYFNPRVVFGEIQNAVSNYNATIPLDQQISSDASDVLQATSSGWGSEYNNDNVPGGIISRGSPLIEDLLATAAEEIIARDPRVTTELDRRIVRINVNNTYYNNVQLTDGVEYDTPRIDTQATPPPVSDPDLVYDPVLTDPGTDPVVTNPGTTTTVVVGDSSFTSTETSETRYVQVPAYSDNRNDISFKIIPWMRSVTTTYKVNGCKPNSIFKPYIEKIDVSNFVTPASELTISNVIGMFDHKVFVGSEDAAIRKIDGNPLNALNRGDVITGTTSGATAVLIDIEVSVNAPTFLLSVVNIKGTFTNSESITGSYSGATAVLDSISTPTEIKSTPYGNFSGLLVIPNTPLIKFNVGTIDILFINTDPNEDLIINSWVSGKYSATGTLTTIQPRITNIQPFISAPIITTTYTSSSTTGGTTTTTTGGGGGGPTQNVSVSPTQTAVIVNDSVPNPPTSTLGTAGTQTSTNLPTNNGGVDTISPATSYPPTSEEIVNRAYINVLGRQVEGGSSNFWVQALESGTITEPELNQAIADGAINEDVNNVNIDYFNLAPTDPQIIYTPPVESDPSPVAPMPAVAVSPVDEVTQAYNDLFGRAPDSGGLAFWSSALTNGSVSVTNLRDQIYTGTQTEDINQYITNYSTWLVGAIRSGETTPANCTTPGDPLCQSFFVEEASGICVTGIDLFFTKKDPTLPVNVAIINMDGGFPGTLTYPLSEIMVYPNDISLHHEYVMMDGISVRKPTPTRITFKAPVYLEGNSKSYGIYIRSDSKEYEVWTSYMGEGDILGKGVISSQPLLGSLFKSQNSRTWTTDQYEDLNFTLYKAFFDTHTNGSIPLINSDIPSVNLNVKCGKIVAGSSLIRFVMFNHGLSNGDTIQISGLVSGTYGGTIPETNINGIFTVTNIDFNTFVIETGIVAAENDTISQTTGLYITENIKADYITPLFKEFVPTFTNLTYKIKPHNKSDYSIIKNKDENHLDSTLSIYNPIGEVAQLPTGESSIDMSVRLKSDNINLSPMLFMDGTNIITGNNLINKPDIDDYLTPLDLKNLTFSPTNSGSTLESKIETSSTGLFYQMVIGNVVILYDGTTATTAGHIGEYVVTDVQDNYIIIDGLITIPSNMYLDFSTRYLDEITPLGSSSVSKYVSKQLKFANISKGFKLILTYHKPVNTFIDVYYRVSDSISKGIIHSDLKYNKIHNLKLSDCAEDSYREGYVLVNNLDDFDTLNIKIVFNSDDANNIPKLSDFRLICVI
jgi:hypothetical protein